eukprot:2005886-Rhodomonas_salina.2
MVSGTDDSLGVLLPASCLARSCGVSPAICLGLWYCRVLYAAMRLLRNPPVLGTYGTGYGSTQELCDVQYWA